MASLYGIADVEPPPAWQQLWGKLSRDKTSSHPLICHMLDVAVMTLALWKTALTKGQRMQWATTLQMNVDDAGRLLAFWAGLHDLGKASPAFQRQWAAAEETLAQVGLRFERLFVKEFCPHGHITTATLPNLLSAETGISRPSAKHLARALGGHHGAWPTPLEDQAVKSIQRGGTEWDAVRHELLVALRDELQPPSLGQWPLRHADANALLTWFSGLVSVADWLGSMEDYFPYVDLPLDVTSYARQAEEQAYTALDAVNWTDWQLPTVPRTFEEQFPFKPRPGQRAIIDLAETLEGPALVLIEAPTGSGKTEAALYLAGVWARTQQQRGLYVAMPTMATSNQMHDRVDRWLKGRYRQSRTKLLLVHSQARWTEAPPEITLHDEPSGDATPTMAWFLPRKRSLLAPCGVGTVDQTLLSVLQARHFFVRLFGLSRKTVIFDEIHAYDTYMSALFQRLLEWLRSMGTSVILLSATLPAQTRRELIEAYAGHPVDLAESLYPAATWVTEDAAGCTPLPPPDDYPVSLGWIDRDPQAVTAALRQLLAGGGCAAVICNTVARAQEVYRALQTAGLVPDDTLILFHARFPFGRRDEIEKGVLSRFGKSGTRPDRAIVVATQVIEQSLDLDFDVMVSDLAPVDLLIQRAGRMHRHPGRDRPAAVATPHMILAVDIASAIAPDFDRDVYVYEHYLLLRTYLVLRERTQMMLPGEGPALLEDVYGDGLLPGAPPELESARQALLRNRDKEMDAALRRLVAQPGSEGLLSNTPAGLAEDDPRIHTAFQALTRLGPASISLVCLHATPNGLNTEPDGSGITVDPDHKPDSETTRAIARATLSVSHRKVVAHYMEEHPPSGWRRHALLQDHRLTVFEDGHCPVTESLHLRLTREFGLEVDS